MIQTVKNIYAVSDENPPNFARSERQYARIKQEYDYTMNAALTEYCGMVEMLKRGVDTDNVIYYRHSGYFGVGWQRGLNDAEKTVVTDQLHGFQWPWGFVESA